MSYYVLAPDGVVEKYPYTLTDMIRDNPGTSFPRVVSDEVAASLHVYPVTEEPIPSHNPEAEDLVRMPPTLTESGWVQSWSVTPLSEEEKASRVQARRSDMAVTPFQAKAALLIQGMLDDVEAIIGHPDTDPLVTLAWATALEFRRTSPALAGIAQALGWTDQQLDDLFTLAATIEA